MNFKISSAAVGFLLTVTGCAQTHSMSVGRIDPSEFGEANRQTYAAMIVDPDPQYDEPLPTSAEHASDAIERYRNNQVEQPEAIRTTGGS